jgi:hypothetical protein
MCEAPKPHTLNLLSTAVVVAILGAAQPIRVTHSLARTLAFSSATVFLTSADPMIGDEYSPAVRASLRNSSSLFGHGCPDTKPTSFLWNATNVAWRGKMSNAMIMTCHRLSILYGKIYGTFALRIV